ncbi:MAG TPA: ribulokinase [Phycisphaerae bacterium]|nr:ribulokinase [Phycisphaerae bacterium]
MGRYTIGLDYGTNSMRALLVNVATGAVLSTAIYEYPHGTAGVVLDAKDSNLARQHPEDYLDGAETAIRKILKEGANLGAKPESIIGIGIDTTGSTPMPVDENCVPLACLERFKGNPAALAWLWKDHTSHVEAEEITSLATEMRPQYLAKCGGRYSSEWFWAKILHCAKVAPEVFDGAATWVEIADWIPAALCGVNKISELRRGICAAGHKAFYNTKWGGYPDSAFIEAVDRRLNKVLQTLPAKVFNVSQPAGALSPEWAKKLGLPAGIPVAIGAFDVHLGAIGSGIEPGVLVKIMGTSTCDLMIAPLGEELADIPGLCGIVPESVLPDFYGMEAGQSAVGDIFNWFVQRIKPGGAEVTHASLTAEAAKLKPGESGLLALDWHNGNRTVLVDQRLTGAIWGLTLHTSPAEIYRALIESTAFGARVIAERFEEYHVPVRKVICGGGIAVKNSTAMQIYANIFGRPVQIASSEQTCALGSAIAAAVVAGSAAGGYEDFGRAISAMVPASVQTFTPEPEATAVYERLYVVYRRLHDAFGVQGTQQSLADVMKELLAIRDQARGQ